MDRLFWLALGAVCVVTCGGRAVVDGSSGASSSTSSRASATTVTGTGGGASTGPGDPCLQQPDLGSCVNCLCTSYPAACAAYRDVADAYYYCGQTCQMSCVRYCTAMMMTGACGDCVETIHCSNPQPGSPQ